MRSSIALLFACFSIGVLTRGVVPAQSLSDPIEGFTFDAPTQSVRALNGFPGSATFGRAILSDVAYGSVAPRRDFAIAFRDGNFLVISGLGSGPGSTSVVPGAFGQPEGALWSKDSSRVVLYSTSRNWIQILTGLPAAPHFDAHEDLSALGGTVSAVASDASAKQIAIAIRGTSGGVYLSTPTQSMVPLAKMTNPVALAFSEDGASLYALDGSALKLEAITLSNWSSRTFSLQALRDPFAIGVGHDAANLPLIYVASKTDRVLGVYSPASQKMISTIPLRFQPTGLQDFGQSSFVIASRVRPSDPLWLFTTTPRPAVYFVPAAPMARERR